MIFTILSEGNDGRAVRVLLILSQYNRVRRVVRLGVRSKYACVSHARSRCKAGSTIALPLREFDLKSRPPLYACYCFALKSQYRGLRLTGVTHCSRRLALAI
jgi:hypothetical protein